MAEGRNDGNAEGMLDDVGSLVDAGDAVEGTSCTEGLLVGLGDELPVGVDTCNARLMCILSIAIGKSVSVAGTSDIPKTP
jgi:hypothetical protein